MAEMDQAKYLFELQSLETSIKNELDLDCQILQSSPEIPVDSLLVTLEADAQDRPRVASVMFVPLADTDIESLKLLQFYCETPVHVESAAMDRVALFLSAVNLKTLIGAFSIDSERIVTFRYVYALGKFKTIDMEEFLETFMLWMFALDMMTPLIEEVATGDRELAAAIAALDE